MAIFKNLIVSCSSQELLRVLGGGSWILSMNSLGSCRTWGPPWYFCSTSGVELGLPLADEGLGLGLRLGLGSGSELRLGVELRLVLGSELVLKLGLNLGLGLGLQSSLGIAFGLGLGLVTCA